MEFVENCGSSLSFVQNSANSSELTENDRDLSEFICVKLFRFVQIAGTLVEFVENSGMLLRLVSMCLSFTFPKQKHLIARHC